MTESAGSSEGRRRLGSSLLWCLGIVAVWGWASAPVLKLGLVGDDYQWWQHAREAVERPALLLAPYGGYRPVTTWLLAADYLLHGTAPAGYHATNLVLQLVASLALWAFLARLGCRPAIRAAAVLLWLTSPYAAEPAWTVSQRFEPVLLASWLALGTVWPRHDERWSLGRSAIAVGLGLLTVFTKETWVVLPGFTLAFDLFLRRERPRLAVMRAALVGIAVGAYLALYFSHPPIAPGKFFSAGLAGAYKVAHAWAVFIGLTSLHPLGVQFGIAEVVALLVIVTAIWLAWRLRNATMAAGLAFYLLPFLPILPVGWLTSRYTTIPLAGFLIVAAGLAEQLISHLNRPLRQVAAVGAGTLLAVMMTVNLLTLRGDLADAGRYWALHAELLAEATAFAPALPKDRTIVTVRLEHNAPLVRLSQEAAGIPKAYFVREADPDTLVDWSALFSYDLDVFGGPIFADVSRPTTGPDPYVVVGHLEHGFTMLIPRAGTVHDELAAWRRTGAPAKAIRPWSP